MVSSVSFPIRWVAPPPQIPQELVVFSCLKFASIWYLLLSSTAFTYSFVLQDLFLQLGECDRTLLLCSHLSSPSICCMRSLDTPQFPQAEASVEALSTRRFRFYRSQYLSDKLEIRTARGNPVHKNRARSVFTLPIYSAPPRSFTPLASFLSRAAALELSQFSRRRRRSSPSPETTDSCCLKAFASFLVCSLSHFSCLGTVATSSRSNSSTVLKPY